MSEQRPWWDRDTFVLHRLARLQERYAVLDELGNSTAFVERPRHLFSNLLALLAGVAVAWLALLVGGPVLLVLEAAPGWLAVGCLLEIFLLGSWVAHTLSKRRHAVFYRDDTRRQPLLEIFQDRRSFFHEPTWTVRLPHGKALARLTYLSTSDSWACAAPDTTTSTCVAEPDSSDAGRPLLGPSIATHNNRCFVIKLAGSDQVIGHYLPRGRLDFSAESRPVLDRRVGLALGFMLDIYGRVPQEAED